MRQKEVIGQSIRNSKSARPGTITYVPIDEYDFKSIVPLDKKKYKIKKIAVMVVAMILVMSCCIYAGVSYYYSYHFFFGTTINGIDSSNKTAYEVEKEIAGKKDNYAIQVRSRMQDPQIITGKDIDYQYVSSGAVLKLLKAQKPYKWIKSFFEKSNYMLQEDAVFSREKLQEQVRSLNCAQKENQIAPENAYVSFNNSEFTIVPETEGNELNTKEAYQMISGAIDNEATEVDLESDPKVYKEADVTRDSAELQDIVNAYNNLAKANIRYTFGDETVTLDGNTIKDWLQFDEKGQLLQNDEAFRQHVVDYVTQLAADHDTVGTERQFQTTSGRTVYVYGSAYGWKIDQDKEVAQLMQEIQSGTQTTREPVYSMRANAHGINDLGDTYIEVDLTEQYMWYYQNGNIILQSEIVSGLPSDPDRKTPPGIFTLNSKSSPSVLRGEMTANGTYSYEQPVTYWMPFNGGIGFHDADWQPYFGGDRYLTGGSHGCINLPPENAGQLYSLIQYDVPIICFY
ncbi:L,D-transpeptidase family protein [Blautia massiliensis (ex Durand et al. 2017)]|uniref:L,D-transpeptidase family protein n=1 Tax=Blautia massiliensis (ex Durand et al. 2017) TaxID=1737424 RepID=UPI00241E6437|nr:L,D-transpeptidase family protein [Blautia massiliensis (ex Durand et al. 2017)]MBN2957606.1 L,D-transpeptidase/peptidoglycan binding protein [Blautia massiliensis (ex Durand et al. 2017)]